MDGWVDGIIRHITCLDGVAFALLDVGGVHHGIQHGWMAQMGWRIMGAGERGVDEVGRQTRHMHLHITYLT